MDGVCIFLHHLIQMVNDHNTFISAGSTTHPGLPTGSGGLTWSRPAIPEESHLN